MEGSKGSIRFPVDDEGFRKSTWSKNNPKTCVTVAIKPEGVAIRDSKDKEKNTQYYTNDEWRAFIAGVKNGEFDIPS